MCIFQNPHGLPLSVDFNWSGDFGYVDTKIESNNSNIDPIYSPMMTGGIFAINRDYFWRIGGYDAKMYGWGGENFELSFKTWLCGGRLDVIPCSHVAHLDRHFEDRPYANVDDSPIVNLLRVAEVWMDDCKRLVYFFSEEYRTDPRITTVDEQLEIKKNLNCKPFSWYVENIIPNKFIPDEDSKMYGRLRSGRNMNLCADNFNRNGMGLNSEKEYAFLGQYPCHSDLKYSQYFGLSYNHQLRDFYHCAEVSKGIPFDKILMKKCNGNLNQMWKRTTSKGLRNIASGKCISSPSILSNDTQSESTDLIAIDCNGGLDQEWEFEFMSNAKRIPHKNIGVGNLLSGRFRNGRFKEMCLDDYSQQAPYLLRQYPCIGSNKSVAVSTQNFSFTEHNELCHDLDCADVYLCNGPFCRSQYQIIMVACNGKEGQQWKLTPWNGLKHLKSNHCLTSKSSNNVYVLDNRESLLALLPCDENADQTWRFD